MKYRQNTQDGGAGAIYTENSNAMMKRQILIVLLASLLAVTAIFAAGCSPSQTTGEPGGDEMVADSGNEGGSGRGDSEGAGSAGTDGPPLSEEDAIQIVLDRVPGATRSEVVSFGRDYEDGRWEYDGKLVYEGIEYEFEIDAQNGNILEWELDD